MIHPNLSLIEAIWIIAQIVGLGFALWAYQDALRDNEVAKEWASANQMAMITLARGQIIRAFGRIVFFSLWLFLGTVLGFLELPSEVRGVLFIGVLLITDFIQVLIGLSDRVERLSVMSQIDKYLERRRDRNRNAS